MGEAGSSGTASPRALKPGTGEPGGSPGPPCKFSGVLPQPRTARRQHLTAHCSPPRGVFSSFPAPPPAFEARNPQLRLGSCSGLALSAALGLQARKSQQARDLGITEPQESQQIPGNHSKFHHLCWKFSHGQLHPGAERKPTKTGWMLKSS